MSAEVTAARDARPTILIVDDDADVTTLLEAALVRTRAYAVETAGDARAALDVLASSLVALIVSDVRMPGIDGFEFFRLLRRQRRYRDIPFVFMSAEDATELRVDGFRMGVDDFVTKPIQVAEFTARIETVLRRAARARVAAIERTHNLAGDFSGLAFSDLVGVLQFGQRTGRLWVATPRAPAELLFDDGRLLYVAYGNLEGDEAFYALMAEAEGQFEFTNVSFPPGTLRANVSGSATGLLLEGARRIDHGLTRRAPLAAHVASPGPGQDAPVQPARLLTDAALRQVEEALADPFCLGELRLLSSDAVREWTSATGEGERLHCHLVADVVQGVAALSALAGPLLEDQLAAALRQAPLLAALILERRGALLDVLLLDQTRPAAALGVLRRHPSVVIVAPPGGDFLALPVAARHELGTLWKRLRPALVMGLGRASLAPHLKQFAELAGTRTCIRTVLGDVSESSFDLRPVLATAARQHVTGLYDPLS